MKRKKLSDSNNAIPLKRAAEKAEIPEYRMQNIVDSFFAVLANDIESENFKGVLCRNLGKFVFKPKRVEHIQKLKNGKNIRDSRQQSGDSSELSNDTGTKETLG